MKQKWVFPTLILFVLFYVLTNPADAGPQARDFAGWIGDQAGQIGTFLDGLFEDDDSGGATTPTTAEDPTSLNGEQNPNVNGAGAESTTNNSFSTLGSPIVVRL